MSSVIGDTNIGGTAWIGDEYKWTDDACLAVVGAGEKVRDCQRYVVITCIAI